MDENWNFCGMSKVSISYYKHYRETVKKLTAQGLDEDFIFEHFNEGPDRIIGNIKDDETRTKLLDYVAACLHRGETVTEGDLRSTLKTWGGNGDGCSLNARSEKLTNVNNKPQPAPQLPKEAQIQKPVEPPKSLGEQVRKQQQVIQDPAFTPASKLPESSPGPAPIPDPTPCKSGKACPDGAAHLKQDKIRGLICELANMPVADLGYCHVIERQKRELMATPEFQVASSLTNLEAARPIRNYGTIKVVKSRVPVTIQPDDFSPKQWEFLDKLQGQEECSTVEAILLLVDRAMEAAA